MSRKEGAGRKFAACFYFYCPEPLLPVAGLSGWLAGIVPVERCVKLDGRTRGPWDYYREVRARTEPKEIQRGGQQRYLGRSVGRFRAY